MLQNLFQHAEEDLSNAVLHFELWRMGAGGSHRQKAANLYEKIVQQDPNITNKKRLKDLKAA